MNLRNRAAAALALVLCAAAAARAEIVVLSNLSHEAVSGPGKSYETLVLLKNPGDKPAGVKAYLQDYRFTWDGKTFYPDPGTLERSNAPWVTFFPRTLVLAPGASAEITCVVKVPDDPKLAGSYWSMIMIEPTEATPAVAAGPKGAGRMAIKQVVRYGIQLVTNIGDTGRRDVKILNAALAREEAKTVLTVDVENTGERFLRPILSVELFGPDGASRGRFTGTQMRLYPGSSARFRADLTGVEPGTYKAMVVLDNQDETVFGAEYTLEF